jgi:zinc and cadmium transporter
VLWPVTLALSVLGSVGGLAVASVVLVVHQDIRTRVIPWLVSYAVGTLLAASLLGLIPESLASLAPRPAFAMVLAGILTFFVLEKLVLWRHCHDGDECRVHRSTATLVIVGDAVHTFVDGTVIAAATLVSVPLGLTTALAIVAHEIPQEAGDFAVLLAAGHSRLKALWLNLSSAIGGVIGAIVMLMFGEQAPAIVPFVLAFAAGSFIYIAVADLIPSLHRGRADESGLRQVMLIGLGILTILVM